MSSSISDEILTVCRELKYEGDALEFARDLRALVELSNVLLTEPGSVDPHTLERAAALLASERCRSGQIDRRTIDGRTVAALIFLIECHLVLARADAAPASPEGTPPPGPTSRLERVIAECVRDTYEPEPLGEMLAAQRQRVTEDERPELVKLAFGVCFKRDGVAPLWKEICAAETITSHTGSVALLRDRLDAILSISPQRAETSGRSEAVDAWRGHCLKMQHSDELLSEVCDNLIMLSMSEAEEEDPETISVFNQTKPRLGYHWYTRLRAIRDPYDCNALHSRCSVRPEELDESLMDLALICYMEYHMRHSDIESWMDLCYADERYPRKAMRALQRRDDPPVGHPLLPPMLLRCDGRFHVLHAAAGRVGCVSSHDTASKGIEAWCAYTKLTTQGMLAPRKSCGGLLDTILNAHRTERASDALDMDAAVEEVEDLFQL